MAGEWCCVCGDEFEPNASRVGYGGIGGKQAHQSCAQPDLAGDELDLEIIRAVHKVVSLECQRNCHYLCTSTRESWFCSCICHFRYDQKGE